MIAGTAAGFGLSERTAELLSGSAVIGSFAVLVHHKTGVTDRSTGRQFFRILGITLVERDITLAIINILNCVVNSLNIIGFVGDKGTFLNRQILVCVFKNV